MDTTFKKGTREYEEEIRMGHIYTNLAYVMADTAESFARQAMARLQRVNQTFNHEEKRNWKMVRTQLRLLDGYLRALAFNGYLTQHDCDYENDSDYLYELGVLLCDRAAGDMEVLDEIKKMIQEKFPSRIGLTIR